MKQKEWLIVGLLLVAWIVFLGQPTAVSAKLRHFLIRLTTPLVKLGDWIPTVKSRRQLQTSNDALRTENAHLRQMLHAVTETEAENLRLETLLGLKHHRGFVTVAGHVIGRDASNWWKSIQLDVGTADGIRDNQPVFNATGLIGKVEAAGRGECRVLLLVDPNCKVSALLQSSRTPGVVAGSEAAFQRRPHCEMRYVDRSANIKIGEMVISSGLGGVFPKGIPIGVVGSAHLNQETGLYQDIEIQPVVDFNRLEEVLVIVRQE